MIRTEEFGLYYSAMRRFASEATSIRMVESMADALEVLLEEVQANIPVDTGALQDDANWKLLDYRPGESVSGGVTMMKDGKQKPYAWMREKGGTIVPRASNPTGRLVWFSKDLGHFVAVKSVVQRGSFYMERSLENRRDAIVEKLSGGVTGAFEVFD